MSRSNLSRQEEPFGHKEIQKSSSSNRLEKEIIDYLVKKQDNKRSSSHSTSRIHNNRDAAPILRAANAQLPAPPI